MKLRSKSFAMLVLIATVASGSAFAQEPTQSQPGDSGAARPSTSEEKYRDCLTRNSAGYCWTRKNAFFILAIVGAYYIYKHRNEDTDDPAEDDKAHCKDYPEALGCEDNVGWSVGFRVSF